MIPPLRTSGALAVHLPDFRMERCGWSADVTAVLVEAGARGEEVRAVTAAGSRLGIVPGMSLSGARALAPQVRVERLDPSAEQEDLEALALLLEAYAPEVRVLPPQTLSLDAGPAVMELVARRLEQLGHEARLVHAPTRQVAVLLAEHAGRPRMEVSEEEVRAALAPLPLEALGLAEPMRTSLQTSGIRTLGALARLPAASLARRFGAAGREAHARARGERAPTPAERERPPRAPGVWEFEEALSEEVGHLEGLLAVVRSLLEKLARRLERRQQAVTQLGLVLLLDASHGGTPLRSTEVRLDIRLGRAMQGVEGMFRVLRLRLEPLRLEAPVCAVVLEARQRVPWVPTQASLLGAPEGGEPLAELCARLQDAWGMEAVVRWRPRDSWRPEAEWEACPWEFSSKPSESERVPEALDPAAPHACVPVVRPRPSGWLPEARALEVEVDAQGRPVRLRLEGGEAKAWGRTVDVCACDGPERLEGGRAPVGGEYPWSREYWSVGLEDGRFAWIYQDFGGEDPEARGLARWFLQAWWEGAPPAPLGSCLRSPIDGGRGAGRRGRRSERADAPYAELLARSCFSFREGASTPEALVEQAEALGLSGLALTDRDGLYGSVRFHAASREARARGFRAIQGAMLSIRMEDGAWGSVGALVMDRQGWARLCRLITRAHAQEEKGRGALPFEALLEANEGLLLLARGVWSDEALGRLREAAPERTWRALSRQLGPGEEAWINGEIARAQALGIPCVATNDVLFHHASQAPLHDLLASIRRGHPLPGMGRRLLPNTTRRLLAPEAFRERFARWPHLLEETLVAASRCTFSLDEIRYGYPREVVPEGYTPIDWLRELCRRGTLLRYGMDLPVRVSRQLEHELGVIERLDFASYFLTVQDLVRFARSRGILCQGRGSAANSAVCYVLGVTAVDPAQQALLFERFLSEERGEPPDIDIDFEHERREEVLQYVYETYGRDRAAMVNEVICWRGRMAVRDAGKAVGMGVDQVERLAAAMDHGSRKAPDEARLREAGLDPADPALRHVQEMVGRMTGLPRHTSIHVGGFVISDGPLVECAPVEPAAMEGRTVLQWDKDDVDALGFVKVDLLALGMLTAIRRAFTQVRVAHGLYLDLSTVPREDPGVYEMLCNADSTGVFQVESRAQQGMLPRLQPRCFYDLVVETAIVRPGPIQGGMVHPYLRRRAGEEAVTYVDPRLEPILARTLGVPIFQEQVMAMAVAVGGFTPGEADQLRRAMGAWRRKGNLGSIGERLMEGLRAQGLPEAYCLQIFAQIQGFAEYGFPESHAASFAHLVYVSAWLRCHYPAAFCAALLDSQPMGFYAPRSLVADAQRHGVEVRPVDVRISGWDCSLEEGSDGMALRLGMRLVQGVREEEVGALLAARSLHPFEELGDLARRAGCTRSTLRLLARAGAMDAWMKEGPAHEETASATRRAVWAVEGLGEGLFAGECSTGEDALPPDTSAERLSEAYATTGLSVDEHPVGLVRPELQREGVVPLYRLEHLPHETVVEIAGLVAHRQRPSTASGVVFLGLEDETGTANVVIWPRLYEAQRALVRGQPLLRIRGLVQRQGSAVSVLAQSFRALQAPPVHARSRDFR